MNLPDGLLNTAWTLLSWVIFLPLALRAVWRAPWRMLADKGRLHVWLGGIVVLMLLWSLQAGVRPGLSLHLLGATVLTLCFGWELAFIGLCVVLAATALNGAGGGWEAYAANALLMAGVGVGASNLLYRIGRYVLPRHFFVYVFANGFFGAALAIMTVGLISSLVFAVQGAYSFDFLRDEYLPYFLLLGFSEAWLSGMAMTLFVVYRPEWVATFEDAEYLAKK